MSKSKSKIKIQCLCCKDRVDERRLKKVASLFPFDGAMTSSSTSFLESFVQIISRYPSFYQWACDDCIREKKALLGKPNKQFYTFKYPWDIATPYLAYFDKRFTCDGCKIDFVFSKEEQQHWYEELRFVVYSKPKYCKACRKEARDAKNLNTELSNLLKDGAPDDAASLERIAEIYEQMGKMDKMKAYLKAAKKKR